MFKYLVIHLIFWLLEYCLSYSEFHPSHGVRIVGGQSANISDYPYQVAILFDDRFECGGSIIGENYILTAAHCTVVNKHTNITIRAGSSFRNSGGQVVGVDKVYQHPKFNIDTYDYDVAILHLNSQLVLGPNVNIIQVTSAGEKISNNKIAAATGWGKLEYNADFPEQLQGDSGGPLVMDSILIGITSWGEVCGAPNFPGAFTKISALRKFIDETLKDQNGTLPENKRS